jgi:osmoprotectant transport system permease protein
VTAASVGQLAEQLRLLPEYLTAHLQLTLIAMLLGATISVPAGIWVTRHPRLEHLLVGTAGVIQTIPGLALLAIMVPLLAAGSALTTWTLGLELPSIGFLPAIIGLTLYSMLPILRNTVTGLAGVDAAIVEAARGVGMTAGQQLARVTLPLAMPVIVAGLRTSTVWIVGIATLSTPVGATSLGNYIFSGLQTRNVTAVSVGCAASAVLALFLDQLIHSLEVGMRARRRGLVAGALGILLALYAYTGLTMVAGGGAARQITIGTKTFTEQYILSEILARQIETVTDTRARILSSLGSTVAFDALRTGSIDTYVDYAGTIWATIMKRTSVPDDRRMVLEEVRTYLARVHRVAVVAALGFENAYALAMRADAARTLGIRTISELRVHAPALEIAGDYEFFSRPEWTALEDTYGLGFRGRRSMDPSLMYQAVAGGQVDVISAFSTDGRIAALDLAVLVDDRRAIPPYDAIILAGPRLVRDEPAVVAALGRLAGTIGADDMRRMNLAVDRDGTPPASLAVAFLATRRPMRGR